MSNLVLGHLSFGPLRLVGECRSIDAPADLGPHFVVERCLNCGEAVRFPRGAAQVTCPRCSNIWEPGKLRVIRAGRAS